MCEWIENYFSEGEYDLKAVIEPSCVFPNGEIRIGKIKIKKIYECGNPKKFLSLSIISESPAGVSIQNYITDCLWTFSATRGTGYSGNIKLCKDKIVICGKGYSDTLGKNIKLKIITEKTNSGFVETFYYLNDKEYIKFNTRTYTKIA